MDEVRLGSRTLQPGRQLLADGQREPIGKRALDILSVLAAARGAIVTKDELLEAVWPGIVVEENALQVHVVALRKALGSEADRLKTIRGVGYQLEIGDDATSADRGIRDELPASNTTYLSSAPRARSTKLSVPAWISRRSWRSALGLAALLLLLAGGRVAFGDNLGLRPQERIALVVRGLAASGGNPTESALASGITDELIVRLRRLPELRVATAAPDDSVPGDAFAQAHVFDGTIRSIGDRLRVTARLTDAEGEIVWSQSFERPLVELFDVQEAIAASISGALGVSLEVGANSAEFGGTSEPEALTAYMEYKYHLLDSDQRVPMRHLERALAIDPNYVKALAGVSTSYGIQSTFAPTAAQAEALLARMDSSTARAVAANPDLWIGHAARGNYHNERKDFAAAARSYRRVAQLDKGIDPELRQSMAFQELLSGRAQRALALLDSNEAIDPIARNDPLRIWALTNAGKHSEAIALFERLSAADPDNPPPYTDFAFWAYLALGREADAMRFAEQHGVRWLTLFRQFQSVPDLPSFSAAQLRQWANRQYADGGQFQLASTALIASHYGDSKLAVDLLRLALERPGGYAVNILWRPGMAATRRTDEFKKLVADVGMERFWRESGQWPDACRPLSTREITCG